MTAPFHESGDADWVGHGLTRTDAERMFVRIFNASSNAMAFSNAEDGRIVDVNATWCRATGNVREHAIGRTAFELGIWPDSATREACLAEFRARGRLADYEMQLRMRDGLRTVLTSAEYVELPALGRFILWEFRDIEELKRAEAARRAIEESARQTQKLESLGLLAGGIAHDFNNLLTVILGNASLMEPHTVGSPPLHELVLEVQRSARRAADLAHQMLAYSGRGALASGPIRLDTLVREMGELLGSSIDRNAMLRLDLAPVTIDGDATQVRQVVMNLITNASDALEGRQGVVMLRTGARMMTAGDLDSPFIPGEFVPGRYAFVEVTDTGMGIEPSKVERIFDPFFTTKSTGRGLGLSAVLGIVRGHHGSLQVTSRPGKGTRFEVFFPATDAMPAHPPEGPARIEDHGGGTLLVIDDETPVRLFVERALVAAGFEVLAAAGGPDGLALFEEHHQRIDGLLIDLTMPRMDGLEVLRQIRTRDAAMPVLLMSGYSRSETAIRAAGRGAGFIQKPFTQQELVAEVGRLVKQAG